MSHVGLTGFGYSSSSEEEDGEEDGQEDGEEEEELSESEEDDDRAWERIRRKRMAFERRMQEMEERQRGTSESSC